MRPVLGANVVGAEENEVVGGAIGDSCSGKSESCRAHLYQLFSYLQNIQGEDGKMVGVPAHRRPKAPNAVTLGVPVCDHHCDHGIRSRHSYRA
jgi:hypothetical protein